MKSGVLVALTLAFAISGFALIFCRKENPGIPLLPASKANAGGRGRVVESAATNGNPPRPERRAKPKSPARTPATRTPAQEAAEKARLERIAGAIASYEQALAAHDEVAVSSYDFLAANGQRQGVVTTATGLQYEILTVAGGPLPAATDTVQVHYHGTLPDGTVFDSSLERGEPISFPMNAVIEGWKEGVQLMPAGSKFKLFIPPYLAYGENRAGANIPGHAALVFEVELLAIEPK
jgi:FKBP-type peptidyl-prolyl cis-trans isomerase